MSASHVLTVLLFTAYLDHLQCTPVDQQYPLYHHPTPTGLSATHSLASPSISPFIGSTCPARGTPVAMGDPARQPSPPLLHGTFPSVSAVYDRLADSWPHFQPNGSFGGFDELGGESWNTVTATTRITRTQPEPPAIRITGAETSHTAAQQQAKSMHSLEHLKQLQFVQRTPPPPLARHTPTEQNGHASHHTPVMCGSVSGSSSYYAEHKHDQNRLSPQPSHRLSVSLGSSLPRLGADGDGVGYHGDEPSYHRHDPRKQPNRHQPLRYLSHDASEALFFDNGGGDGAGSAGGGFQYLGHSGGKVCSGFGAGTSTRSGSIGSYFGVETDLSGLATSVGDTGNIARDESQQKKGGGSKAMQFLSPLSMYRGLKAGGGRDSVRSQGRVSGGRHTRRGG